MANCDHLLSVGPVPSRTHGQQSPEPRQPQAVMDVRRVSQELLRAEAVTGFEVRIRGDCMTPVLHHGDRVLVRASRYYLPGDILVHLAPDGRRLSHRLLGYYRRRGGWRLLTQADNSTRPDTAIAPQQVLGKVTNIGIDLRQRVWAAARFFRFAVLR
jgi:phage repressor protein C with HTH and peptisase S24 domain